MSQTIKVSGTILHIAQPRFWGEDNANKATKFYLDTDPDTQYPSQVEMEVYQDRIDLSKFKAGDKVEVNINFKGATRPYNGKNVFFQNIDAWKMELVSAPATPPATPPDDNPSDDLPF